MLLLLLSPFVVCYELLLLSLFVVYCNMLLLLLLLLLFVVYCICHLKIICILLNFWMISTTWKSNPLFYVRRSKETLKWQAKVYFKENSFKSTYSILKLYWVNVQIFMHNSIVGCSHNSYHNIFPHNQEIEKCSLISNRFFFYCAILHLWHRNSKMPKCWFYL